MHSKQGQKRLPEIPVGKKPDSKEFFKGGRWRNWVRLFWKWPSQDHLSNTDLFLLPHQDINIWENFACRYFCYSSTHKFKPGKYKFSKDFIDKNDLFRWVQAAMDPQILCQVQCRWNDRPSDGMSYWLKQCVPLLVANWSTGTVFSPFSITLRLWKVISSPFTQ